MFSLKVPPTQVVRTVEIVRHHLGQLHQLFGPVVADQGQIYSLSYLREHREVRPGAVVRGSEGIRTTRPFLHLKTVATSTPRPRIPVSITTECSPEKPCSSDYLE